MNGVQLFVLGHKLVKLAEQALPSTGVRPGDRLILFDASSHPGSSISEITERTGYPQSHVSTTVAKFREIGVLTTQTDPADRRRTLVTPVPAVLARSAATVHAPVEGVLAGALGPESDVDEVIEALELLGRRLTPASWGWAGARR